MNVTIIYGAISKTNTYNCVQLLLKNLRLNMDIKVTEFFLQNYSPCSCHGCSSHLINNEEKHSPHDYYHSISKSLDDSDLIILASPVFTCDISTEMKSLLDSISSHYMLFNTNSLMHNKIGLVMSTTAGAGLFNATRTLKRNLHLWGINNILKFSETLYEMNWKEVSLKTKKQINKKFFKLSTKIFDLYTKSHSTKEPISNEIPTSQNETLLKENHCTVTDFNYLKKRSYLHARN